ncbi:MAG: transglutaminase domain-containing protein, partial [Clostridia bacterium]|nr:transglutaminase domain-containing protein [Clostridia bacterium]
KSINYIQAPKITSIKNTTTGSQISWSKCNCAAKYRVLYKDKNGNWKTIEITDKTTTTHKNLTNGLKYTYTVRCLDKNNKYISGFNAVGTSNTFIAPPKIVSVSGVSGGNLVKWKSDFKAVGYRLYRKTVDSSWQSIADVKSGTQYTDKSAKKNVVYSYMVRCLDKNGKIVSSYITDNKYYKNGTACDGKVKIGTKYYKFINGVYKGLLKTGYHTVNGKEYYYNSNGDILKNCIVGSGSQKRKYASPSGVIIKSAEIQAAVDFVVAHGGSGTSYQKLTNCYKYLVKNCVYKRDYGIPSTNANFKERALSVFNKNCGNCFAYSTALSCISRVLGFDSREVTGQIGSRYGGVTPHGWNETYIDGKWYISDVIMEWEYPACNYYMRTYANYPTRPFYAEQKYNIVFNGDEINWKKISF